MVKRNATTYPTDHFDFMRDDETIGYKCHHCSYETKYVPEARRKTILNAIQYHVRSKHPDIPATTPKSHAPGLKKSTPKKAKVVTKERKLDEEEDVKMVPASFDVDSFKREQKTLFDTSMDSALKHFTVRMQEYQQKMEQREKAQEDKIKEMKETISREAQNAAIACGERNKTLEKKMEDEFGYHRSQTALEHQRSRKTTEDVLKLQADLKRLASFTEFLSSSANVARRYQNNPGAKTAVPAVAPIRSTVLIEAM